MALQEIDIDEGVGTKKGLKVEMNINLLHRHWTNGCIDIPDTIRHEPSD